MRPRGIRGRTLGVATEGTRADLGTIKAWEAAAAVEGEVALAVGGEGAGEMSRIYRPKKKQKKSQSITKQGGSERKDIGVSGLV